MNNFKSSLLRIRNYVYVTNNGYGSINISIEQQLEQLWWSTSPARMQFYAGSFAFISKIKKWTWQLWWSTRRKYGPVPSRRKRWSITPIFSLLPHIGWSDNIFVAALLLVRDFILKFEIFLKLVNHEMHFYVIKFMAAMTRSETVYFSWTRCHKCTFNRKTRNELCFKTIWWLQSLKWKD